MRRYLLTLIAPMFFLAVSAVEIAAQCGKWDYTDCDDDEHTVAAASADLYTNTHSECRLCAIGNCGHGACGVEDSDLVPQLLSAIGRSDAGAVLDFLAEHPEMLALNRSRRAVQLSGCVGETLGHFPLGAAYEDLLGMMEIPGQ